MLFNPVLLLNVRLDVPIKDSSFDSVLTINPVSLEFEGNLLWDVIALSEDWASWMCRSDRKPNISKIGVMSSLCFQRMLSPWVSSSLSDYFRLLIYTSSIIYNHGPQASYPQFALGDFYAARSLCGAKVLASLEKLMRPAELAKATKEKISAIFLLLFGTTLAVLYSERLEDSMMNMVSRLRIGSIYPAFLYIANTSKQLSLQHNTSRASAREFNQLQDQLIGVLAHRLVEMADRLNILDNCISRELLVHSAKKQWHLPASFVWSDCGSSKSINVPTGVGNPSYDVYSLCWKGFEPQDRLEYWDNSLFFQEAILIGIDNWTWRTTISTSPLSNEVKDLSVASFANPAGDTAICKQCGAVLPDGFSDNMCYTCSCIPSEDLEVGFGWTTPDPPPEATLLPLVDKTNHEYTSNSVVNDHSPQMAGNLVTLGSKLADAKFSFRSVVNRVLDFGHTKDGKDFSQVDTEIAKHHYEAEQWRRDVHVCNGPDIPSDPRMETRPRSTSPYASTGWTGAVAERPKFHRVLGLGTKDRRLV